VSIRLDNMGGCIIGGGALTIYLGSFAAWVTAIVHTVKTDDIAMLLVDILIPPVGVIHGLMIWFT